MAISDRDFGRLESKVDFIVESIAEIKADDEKVTNDHETRIRGLEHWRWGIPATFLGTIATFLLMNINIA